MRDAEVQVTPTPTFDHHIYLPLALGNFSGSAGATSTPTPEPASDGYTLFAPLGETSTYLIDTAGDTVHTWSSSYPPGNAVYLLENGNLLHTGNTRSANFDTGGAGGIVEEIAPDGTVGWSFEYDSAQGRLHHDVEALSQQPSQRAAGLAAQNAELRARSARGSERTGKAKMRAL